jgi:hypothetical protein
MKSHLISQVILKQFTNAEGKVFVHDKKTGATAEKFPHEVAYKEIDKKIIEATEQLWSKEIEADAVKVINKLYDGGILYEPKHEERLKSLMALHFVRSEATFVLVEMQARKHRLEIETSMLAEFPEKKELILKKLEDDWDDLVLKTLVEIIEENRKKVDDYLNTHGLEIGIAPEGTEFLIGDCPAIPMASDGRMGVLNGVAILEASSFAMPLTKKHIVAAKSKPQNKKYIELSAAHVKAANKKQQDVAVGYYYSGS